MHKILVVEDVAIARNVMGLVLERINCNADMAESGIEALKLFFENEYDLVLMDIGLPDLNGVTVTKLIRNFGNKNSSNIPVIAVTAHSEEMYKQDCQDAGMDDFIVKPIGSIKFKKLLISLYPRK